MRVLAMVGMVALVGVATGCGEDEPTHGGTQSVEQQVPRPAVDTSPSGAWFAEVARSIAEDQRQPQTFAGGFALHAGDLHARLDASGIELADGWRFDYVGDPALAEVEGSRVVYRRGAGVTEWYEARPEGIEQGFTITELPPDGVDLVVRGRVETHASARVVDDGVMFGELRYAGLTVLDAVDRPLRAAIEWDAEARVLALRVPAEELARAELPIVIDPLLSSTSWTADPTDQAAAFFGLSVAGAGDVNGDGYADVAVAAPYWDGAATNEGRAYLYLGSAAGLVATPAWMADPADQASAIFGSSVAGAGDVNADGFADVVVGAAGWGNEGRAYLYLGSAAGLAASAAWTADPTDQTGSVFASSVAGAGDVNGDGFADVVATAADWDGPAGAEQGRAYLYLGSAGGLAASPAWTANPTNQSSSYLGSAASAGDVNGDGFADVIVGARAWDGAATNEGRAYLYLGSAAGLAASPAWTADPTDQFNAQFGYSVAGAGDVNGDGFADVAVGAPYWDGTTGTDEGRVHVYLGSAAGLAASAAWTAEPTDQANSDFGFSMAGAGDVNGDGFADLMVAAYGWDGAATDEGRAYLYLGSEAGLTAIAAWTADPTDQANAWFGYNVAGTGDVNGDGFADVVVGAYGWDGAATDEGRAFLYRGSATGLSTTAAWTKESDQASAVFGGAVASAGDVNGDGFGDVVVGAYSYDNGQTDEGRAYLYLGSATGLSSTAAWTAESDQASAQFGRSVASAGDVNGDGYGDVVVGAWLHDNGQADEGRAYLYLGSATGLSATAAWTAESDQAYAYLGFSVASAGDVNGDGYGDVVVAAYWYDNGQTDEGRASVYLGSATGLSATAAWTAESNQASAYCSSVASAGDVNGDGYGDVVVGADRYDNGQADEGKASLYLGSATGLSATAAWTAESDLSTAYFGLSVASAGDVNGDGYGDVVVGADHYGNGQTYEGRAFVYTGSATGLSASAAWTAESDQDGAGFGWSVASTVDVNGDGFGDVVVGAYAFDNGQTDEGRVFLYVGGDGAPGLARGHAQFKSDGTTPLALGGAVGSGSSVVLKGRVTQENGIGGKLRLEVEVKPVGSPWSGTGTQLSTAVTEGQTATVTVSGLAAPQAYRWRARVVYAVGTGEGRWVSLGGDASASADFRLTGTGTSKIISISPSSLAFGSVKIPSAGTSSPATITNPGVGENLLVTRLQITGAGASNFEFTSNGCVGQDCQPGTPYTVLPGGADSEVFNIRCHPSLPSGAYAASLVVTSNADSGTSTMPMSCTGTAPDINLPSSSVAFGDRVVGTSPTLTFAIQNTSSGAGSETLDYTMAKSGPGQAAYSLVPACVSNCTVAAGGSQTVTVTFSPSARIAYPATITITTDDPDESSLALLLSGTGVAPVIGNAVPAGQSIAFGPVDVGTTSAAQTVSFENTGDAPLSIVSATLLGASASQFAIASGTTGPSIVAAGNTTSWTLTCDPTSIGAKAATFRVVSDALGTTTFDVSLSCTGQRAEFGFAPATVAFGPVPVGSTPTLPVTITNNGNQAGQLLSMVSSSAAVTFVAIGGDLPRTVAPAGSVTFDVTFAPLSGASIAETLTATTDGFPVSLVIPVTGDGLVSGVAITPAPDGDDDVDLGVVCVGSPLTQVFTIQNEGENSVHVLVPTTDSASFTVVATGFPADIAAGGDATFLVEVDPAIGDVSGNLTIVTDIPSSTTYTLTATGLASGIGVSPAEIDFGTVDPDSTSPASAIVLTNCDPTALGVELIALQGADPDQFAIVTGGTAALSLLTTESHEWTVRFEPDRTGDAVATFHVDHDHATGGGAIDVDLVGAGAATNPDAGPDGAVGPDGGIGLDESSYYACNCSSASGATAAPYAIVVLLGLGWRRRRRR